MEETKGRINETKEETSEIKEDGYKARSAANWAAILFYLYLHVLGTAGLYFLVTRAKWMTVFYFSFLVITSYIGITVGAHRYYAHQTFVASWQFRLFVFIAHTIAGVGPIYTSALYHRAHHIYHNTDMDPYDHRKGFLYSHVVSNMLSIPSHVKTKYEVDIDMRDVDEDIFIWVQKKFYWLHFVLLLLLTINIPINNWDESTMNAFLIIGAARLVITTNFAWLINSALLVWGMKKGDRYPVSDNSVFFLLKSYWLNYHYLIPWDWKIDELGTYEKGFATFVVKMFRELGFIEQMKTNTTEDMREILRKVANNEETMKEALEELKQRAEEAAHKEKLVFRH